MGVFFINFLKKYKIKLLLFSGVSNFNSKHGCLKCTTVGEYSHNSHTVYFPKTKCPPRNDRDFRSKKYDGHHKSDSPLLKLNIDMVEDFPVSDSLHLVDLGVMKRLLVGWRDGKFGKYITKWSARDIENVSQFLLKCHKPKEIHRAIRSVQELAHWKASEYRTFLYYLSFVILKRVLSAEAYHHFLCYFCAITICSSEKYFKYLDLADQLLEYFILNFSKFYGKDYMTSNIHNTSHLVSEVKRFGKLQDFNAYPFENKLYSIKKLIRQGKNPLAQIARRLSERENFILENIKPNNLTYPFINANGNNKVKYLQFEDFVLSAQNADKWFLTKENHVVEVINIYEDSLKIIFIQGKQLLKVEDAFETPIRSSFLNIFMCGHQNITQSNIVVHNVGEVKCKLFSVNDYLNNVYFTPLLHTV